MNDTGINILFVAFEFPPLGGAGVQRSLNFVKYLPQYGINPIVITILKTDIPKVFTEHSLDNSLEKEIPPGITIKRIHCAAPLPATNKITQWLRDYFQVSENYKQYWKQALLKEFPILFETYKPRAIYISLPPFAMAPLFREILKDYKIPLVTDFRDAWSQWCNVPNGSYLHYRLKLREERKILDASTKVIFSSKDIMKNMQKVHPSSDPKKFTVITNGYDGALNWETQNMTGNEKIIIGYVGSFYYSPGSRANIFAPWWKKPPHRMLNYVPKKEDWLYRSPYFFFKAIKYLVDQHPSVKDRIEVHFAGHTPGWLPEQIKSFNLTGMCHHHGYLNHDEVLAFQKKCDVLLITSSKVINGRDYSIAGKTFEYFTFGKPILGFVCEGAQKDILIETGMTVICDPDNEVSSAQNIRDLVEGKIVIHPDKNKIEKYQRKLLAGDLATVIKAAINTNGAYEDINLHTSI